jgi:hypothetical protein
MHRVAFADLKWDVSVEMDGVSERGGLVLSSHVCLQGT